MVRCERVDEAALRAAGLETAEAIAVTEPDDAGNLHIALCAREVNPTVRLVVRMFDPQLAQGARELLPDCAVVSDAAMAAPTFVAAALGEVEPTHVRLLGRTVVVARRAEARPRDVICGLAAHGPDGSARVLPSVEDDADLVLAEATGPAATSAARWRRARPRRRRLIMSTWLAVRALLRLRTGIALVLALSTVAVAGTTLAMIKHLGWAEALYLVLATAAGGAEPEPGTVDAAKVAQVVLAVAGLALVPLFTAVAVETIVNMRLARETCQLRKPWADHIVVVGVGNVGIRVIRELRDLGLDVVAIEKDPAARGLDVARRLGIPVIIGDGTQQDVLERAWVGRCRSLVVLSTDDKANLQAALAGQTLRRDLRVVLRLFDHDFAARVQRAFRTTVSRSVAAVSAPTFADQMMNREIRATIPVERHVLLIVDVPVDPGSALAHATVRDAGRAGLVRVVAVRSADGAAVWNPGPGRPLAPGDRVVAVARRAGLAWLTGQATASDGAAPAG
ncbi:NAD-binding protein [Pilimelia columellifera]|uniref:NAD-binding protein n=1 Tax=Pilimelia columellifera subsp. columellifera TaxID=706583 RepID=A0ABN3NEV1_9ACTN